ncbi:phosphatidylethanolamine-binding protein [Alternaria rosae]|uniref:phosphatidylethanolamine-binding protein n=1 Tax=Alternaria rosae TaxID=1187941 RepID=UPI001E8E26A1|nr:phosphatidylethanolamine-binding protein [Alternaria rosae]KAH6868768.1 phosphatidylethanolamine-binding protein [Alternaria rosae]
MANTQTTKQALLSHKVIPDVLPDTINLTYNLVLEWPNAKLDTPGKELENADTKEEPKVFINPAPTETLDNLVLMMVDPDLMTNNDTTFGQVRHWLITNLSSTSSGTLSYTTAAIRSPYVRPAPLPNYISPRPHRYIFILARASSKIEVRPEDLREMQKGYVAAVQGKQGEMQDLKDRWGFNARRLCEEKGLEVLGCSFMRVGGTIESSVANAGMMAQAVGDKVLGK